MDVEARSKRLKGAGSLRSTTLASLSIVLAIIGVLASATTEVSALIDTNGSVRNTVVDTLRVWLNENGRPGITRGRVSDGTDFLGELSSIMTETRFLVFSYADSIGRFDCIVYSSSEDRYYFQPVDYSIDSYFIHSSREGDDRYRYLQPFQSRNLALSREPRQSYTNMELVELVRLEFELALPFRGGNLILRRDEIGKSGESRKYSDWLWRPLRDSTDAKADSIRQTISAPIVEGSKDDAHITLYYLSPTHSTIIKYETWYKGGTFSFSKHKSVTPDIAGDQN